MMAGFPTRLPYTAGTGPGARVLTPVRLVEPGRIERSTVKAKRVVDRRES